MALSAGDKEKVGRGLMRFWSSNNTEIAGLVKADFATTITAVDDWLDTNLSSLNTAIPTVAQDNLNSTQKTLLLCSVASMRVGVNFLRRLFAQEVD